MRTRVTSAVLFTAAVLSLAACSDDDKTEASGTPTTAATSASAPAATSSAPDVSISESGAIPGSAANGSADKVVCEASNTAGEAMKTAMLKIMKAGNGDIKPADAKAILDDFTKSVNQALDQAPESTVSTAAQKVADEAAKAASAADPVEAAAAPGFEKAGTELTAACKAAGISVNF